MIDKGDIVAVEWLVPWVPVADEETSARLRDVLKRELPARHILEGYQFEVVGRRQDQDDVLVALDDDRVAVVHITGSKGSDPNWPWTKIYASFEQWRTEFMVPNHAEWSRWDESPSAPDGAAP